MWGSCDAEGACKMGCGLQHRLVQESGLADLLAGDERSLPGRVPEAGPGLAALLGLLRSVSRAMASLQPLMHRGAVHSPSHVLVQT